MVLELDAGMAVLQIPMQSRQSVFRDYPCRPNRRREFANQATRERRNIRDRAHALIGLVLANNSVRLTAVAVASDRDVMAERDHLDARRFRPQYRTRKRSEK